MLRRKLPVVVVVDGDVRVSVEERGSEVAAKADLSMVRLL